MGGHSTNLKVSSRSAPHSVAGALAGVLRDHTTCEIQVIGAGALNQAVKAMAIARTYLDKDGWDLTCVPVFAEVEIDGRPRTAIRLVIERRPLTSSSIAPQAVVDDVGFDPEREVPGGIFGAERRTSPTERDKGAGR
ncbi:MAG: stage V sporulation protein S [Acidimicrobiia bacterium]|nr:stage V sporulation protein S [Acidimicrobiia bacterium]